MLHSEHSLLLGSWPLPTSHRAWFSRTQKMATLRRWRAVCQAEMGQSPSAFWDPIMWKRRKADYEFGSMDVVAQVHALYLACPWLRGVAESVPKAANGTVLPCWRESGCQPFQSVPDTGGIFWVSSDTLIRFQGKQLVSPLKCPELFWLHP